MKQRVYDLVDPLAKFGTAIQALKLSLVYEAGGLYVRI